MTNILIPYTFVAGTKAKAEEVNANFQTLKSALETTNTSITALSSATDTKVGALTNLETENKTSVVSAINELNGKRPLSAFCINSGYINSSDEAELLSASSANLSFKIDDGSTYSPLKATTVSGESFELTSLAPIDMSGFANGTYNVFVGSNSSVAYANTIYRQKTAPSNPLLNDVWFKTLEPLSAFKYSGTEWEIFNLVPAGQVIVTSGSITSVETFDYNQNGYDFNTQTTHAYITETYVNGSSGYNLYSDGFIEQWGSIPGSQWTSDHSWITLTFLKQFSNTNYNFQKTVGSNYQAGLYGAEMGFKNKQAGSIQLGGNTATYIQSQDWYACGY